MGNNGILKWPMPQSNFLAGVQKKNEGRYSACVCVCVQGSPAAGTAHHAADPFRIDRNDFIKSADAELI